MSRTEAPGSRSIGTGSVITRGPGAGPTFCTSVAAVRAAIALQGSSSRARASTRGSRRRCQAPVTPGRDSAATVSNRTAYGTRGCCRSAAVMLEKITARALIRADARRAASASTRSVRAIVRRSRPAAPIRTGRTSHR
jgi:hypothetical protein